MSVSRPARCVTSSISKARPASQCRNFSSTQPASDRRRPRFASVKAADMGLVSKTPTNQLLKAYSEKDKQALAKRYTPEQLRVIAAGEEAIDLEDIRGHGVVRNDVYGLKYLDDLSVIRPVIDSKPKVKSTISPTARWLDEDQRFDQVNQWMGKVLEHKEVHGTAEEQVEGLTSLDLSKFFNETRAMTGGGEVGSNAFAPALPKIPELVGQFKKTTDIDSRDPNGQYDRIRKQTGMGLSDIMDLKISQLVRHRVVNQTRLGKISSQYVLTVAGNGNGMLGIGEGKSAEPEDASHKARMAAIRNMRPIPRYEERTIFGDVEGKVSAVRVQLMARPPGFGLRCQHKIFEMARCAGIKDLAARVPYARNKMNTIKATYQALMNQRIPDEVARGLGKKLIDVRKVYYGGSQTMPKKQGQKWHYDEE